MKKFIEQIIADVQNGKYIDVYITIFICVLLTILDVLGKVQPDQLVGAILLTLGVLSYGHLELRKNTMKLNDALQKFRNSTGAEIYLKNRKSFNYHDMFEPSQHIFFLAPTLLILDEWADYLQFEKMNKQNAVIQIILLDPNCSAVDSAAKCVKESLDTFRSRIIRSLDKVESMKPDESESQRGSLEFRLMPATPNYTMILLDPEKPNGKIIVEFIGYHTERHNRPHIELTQLHDGKWYDYYLQQYKQIWAASHLPVK